MQIFTTCRHAKMTPALKRHLHERLAKLERFSFVREAHVILEAEKYRQTAEVLLKTRKKELVCREESGDFVLSIDRALDRLERQLKRIKEKETTRILKDGTRTNGDENRGAVRSAARAALAPPELEEAGEEEVAVDTPAARRAARARAARRPRVVPARVTAKPLTVEEAADQLLADGSEFVAFVNAQTEQLNVLFRRPDGDLGLIAPRRAGGRR